VIVLHDLPTGAMKLLPQFLDELEDSRLQVTTQFPADCVPIVNGRVLAPIDHLMPNS
jgi:hypothetical protein